MWGLGFRALGFRVSGLELRSHLKQGTRDGRCRSYLEIFSVGGFPQTWGSLSGLLYCGVYVGAYWFVDTFILRGYVKV